MRIFVTGASGWIGSPTVEKLLAAGHDVVGLARSVGAAAAIPAGATVVRGSLDDLDLLRTEAGRSDGVLHLGFRHDLAFSGDFAGAVASDRAAIDAFGEALKGSDKVLVIASGTLDVAPGRVATERDLPHGAAMSRHANATAALELAANGVRSVVIRFAPTVHGPGDHGFIATLVTIARETGVSGYPGDGTNRWPAVHRFDAADLTARAVERAPAGSILHGTAEEGVPTKAIAEAIGEALSVPVAPVDNPAHFRFLGPFFGMDAAASSALTRELVGWNPTGPTLAEELAAGVYTADH